MWDCKSWYLPLENINLNGFKNLLKTKLEKKNSSTFEFDDDIEENSNNNINNNNSIRNLNPEPDNVGEFSDFHKYAEKHSERFDKRNKELYKRKTSPERIFKDKIIKSINYNNNNFPGAESFTITDNNNNISPLFFKEIRDIKEEYGRPNYNKNAPPYKPKFTKTGTLLVEEEEDNYTESEEDSKDNKIAIPSQPSGNSLNLNITGATVGIVSSLIDKTSQATLQQPFEFIDSNNRTILSYVDNIYSCEGGFFSVNQITIRQTPGLGWYILLTVILSIVFVLIIDSYWPMLFSIYEAINRVAKDLKASILKRDEQIKEEAKKEQADKIIGFFEGVPVKKPKKENEEEGKEVKEKEEKHILLKIWVAACIFASFIGALVLATVITTYIQNLMAFEKDYCTKLSKVQYNLDEFENVTKLSNADNYTN
jgi:hypothetical protein